MSDALMPTYARADLTVERGEGSYLYAADGRRYLDFAGGIAVNILGHAHPHLVEALTQQAQKIWHCSNLFHIPEGERLAERLCASTFAERVFFCNSGAEALECGIKVVRKYHDDRGNPGRHKIITLNGSFHGRTLTTLSAAKNLKHLEGFLPEVPGFTQVAFNNLNELRAAIDDETAAILLEPVQGEGGIRVADSDYLQALRAVCDEFGLLLFFDEVQSGMGRTGKFFAYEWAEVKPDVVAVAKGLGGGFPIGACLTTAEAAAGMTAGTHGSTFGGNPLAMAVANAVLDLVLADGFNDHVQAMSEALDKGLRGLLERHPTVFTEPRGKGLMRGLKCAPPNGEVVARLRDAGLLTVPAGDNVVRMLPALTIETSHIDEAVAIFDQVAAAFAKAA